MKREAVPHYKCSISAETDDAIIAMKLQPESSTQEVLAGLVERVTYHAENGFCVLRAKARGHRDVVTVVGHAAAIAAGEWITASGEWVKVLVGQKKAVAIAVRNVLGRRRWSKLSEWLVPKTSMSRIIES